MSGSPLEGVVTEVLRQHRPTVKRVNHPSRPYVLINLDACKGCDWAAEDGDHDAHVAAVVIAAIRENFPLRVVGDRS
jgi:hypothetical protein